MFSVSTRRRSARDVLARARILCLACNVADGIEIERRWLVDLGLVPHLTAQEQSWFDGETAADYDVWFTANAVLELAWSLGLVDEKTIDEGEFNDVFGEIANRLTVDSYEESDLDADLAPLSDEEVGTRMVRVEDEARNGDPNVRWRCTGLAWILDDTRAWPPVSRSP